MHQLKGNNWHINQYIFDSLLIGMNHVWENKNA